MGVGSRKQRSTGVIELDFRDKAGGPGSHCQADDVPGVGAERITVALRCRTDRASRCCAKVDTGCPGGGTKTYKDETQSQKSETQVLHTKLSFHEATSQSNENGEDQDAGNP